MSGKNKKIISWKSFLSALGIGTLTALSSTLLLQFFHNQFDWEKTQLFFEQYLKLNLLQSGVILIFFLFIYFIVDSAILTSAIVFIISIILGLITQQKMVYRGEPLYPSDIYFLKDFNFLLEMLNPSILIIFLIVLFLFITAFLYFSKKKKKKHHLAFRIAGASLTLLLLINTYHFNQPNNIVRKAFDARANWVPYSQQKNYTENGVVSGLLYNLPSPAMDKPDTFSKEKLQTIYEKYQQKADRINEERKGTLEDINVIFVMSETFSDPLKIEGIKVSGDAIPYVRELERWHLHGEVLSQGYGGGTANIEFEALTGISMEPLNSNITTPFIQLNNKMKEFPSIVDYMNQTNHTSTAIHPFNATMYKRRENYTSLGFHSQIFRDDMQENKKIGKNYYVSDESAFNEVLHTLQKTPEKDFIHLVTMQNHTPYKSLYEDLDFQVEGTPDDLETANYFQGLSYSDLALKDFLEKIDKLEEKTVVVFWGDHLPSLYGKDLYELNGREVMYQTPLLFYTNFSDKKGDVGTISPIFFFNHLFDLAQAPVTPFVAFLEEMETRLPAFEKEMYLERDNGLKNSRDELTSETKEILNDYDAILYDITTGKNYSKKSNMY